jgi:ribosome-associated heat shock protein Hsp15
MTANGNDSLGTSAALRIDKWLFFARFFKSRSLAATLCSAGRVRINRQPIQKAHHAIRVGDVLTFPQGDHIRVVRVILLGVRRGPAGEARTLYEDLAPPLPAPPSMHLGAQGERESGAGRPTKADRRAIDRLHDL